MQIEKLQSYYRQRGIYEDEFEESKQILIKLNQFLQQSVHYTSFDEASTEEIEQFIYLKKCAQADMLSVVFTIARYYNLIGRKDIYIQMTKYIRRMGVIESIKKRMEETEDSTLVDQIFKDLEIPSLGTSPKEVPYLTRKIINKMEENIPIKRLGKILAGNHHQIPKEVFLQEKKLYEESLSLDDYLAGLHKRNIQDLQEHCDQNKVWYEQDISQKVVDYVAQNQEIMSAVRQGNRLYVTKIPYDAVAYLNATSPEKKSYYACHCPFAREAIQKTDVKISTTWCNCSGGFTKYQFDILFDKELEVKTLELALKGDDKCRFEISLEGVSYK
jgi:hypothetical protein